MTPKKRTLNLLFPQWQGSGNLGLYQGARQLSQAINYNRSVTEVPVATAYSLQTTHNILGFSQIHTQLSAACQIISEQNPDRIFTIGSDCGVEIAPVSFLNQKYGQSLAVLWLDAHGDLNTPHSSPSRHFHGMPLRTLLGEGNPDILQSAFSVLKPEQVFLVGTRELDAPEASFLSKQSMSTFTADAINAEQHQQIISTIKEAGFTKLYIHLDLDVLDPKVFPQVACPTPNGLELESIHKLLVRLTENFEIVGGSVLEFLPMGNEQSCIEEAITAIETITSVQWR